MRLIDTHCHLNDEDAFPDPQATIEEALAEGIEALVVVGIDLESSRRAIELAESHPPVWATVGWHPNQASDYSEAGLREIELLLQHPRCVALGEIGLDYYRTHAEPADQLRAFIEQLDLAMAYRKPVVIHCREAYPDLLEILEARARQPLVFHCFAGSTEHAARAVALGGHIGVDGPVTYKTSGPLRSTLATIPRDRLIVETDAPWMAPEPYRGKRNRPAWLSHINEGLAAALGIDAAACAALTTTNARRAFGIA